MDKRLLSGTIGHHREARASAARITDISEMRVISGETVFLILRSVLQDGVFFVKYFVVASTVGKMESGR